MQFPVGTTAAAGDVAWRQHAARASRVDEALMGVVKTRQQPQPGMQSWPPLLCSLFGLKLDISQPGLGAVAVLSAGRCSVPLRSS